MSAEAVGMSAGPVGRSLGSFGETEMQNAL